MKLIEKDNVIHMHYQLKKHLAKSSKIKHSKRRKAKNELASLKLTGLKPLLSMFIDNNPPKISIKGLDSSVKTPRDFCIFDNPNYVLSWLSSFVDTSLRTSRPKIVVDHRKTKKFCLGSEVLLGLLAGEVYDYRSLNGDIFDYAGLLNKNAEHRVLLSEVGIVSELDNAVSEHTVRAPEKIHVFKQDCSINESVSSTGEDLKNTTASSFVKHVNEGLKDHLLKLTPEAANDLKGCLGEVLDNVHEHSGMTAPRWYVRGYMNNEGKKKFLELAVINLGKPIYENFMVLEDDSYAKQDAKGYVDYQLSSENNTLTVEELYTIAALQGNVSSKNTEDDSTRGQGTITLIEAFEDLHKKYVELRGTRTGTNAMMNLVSGKVVIRFDGTYMSSDQPDTHGGERVTIAFNEENNLYIAPDNRHVFRMKDSYFPGLMINIKIPLQGSLVPIGG
jgi:hypothetical protein